MSLSGRLPLFESSRVADRLFHLPMPNKELSTLGIAFDNHILNENNAYQLVIENEADLAGLPEWVKACHLV